MELVDYYNWFKTMQDKIDNGEYGDAIKEYIKSHTNCLTSVKQIDLMIDNFTKEVKHL